MSLLTREGMTRGPRNLFVAIAAVALAEASYEYPLLPDRMASHFGPSGYANGWMNKPAFFSLYVAVVLLAAIVGFALPQVIAAQSQASIHLPNKEYWMAPERRSDTFAYLARQLGWFSCALLLMEVLAMELAIRANFSAPPRIATSAVTFLIAAFVGFTIIWTAGLYRHFSHN